MPNTTLNPTPRASATIVRDMTINNNTAARYGGGMFTTFDFDIETSTISGNTASSGGGVYASTDSINLSLPVGYIWMSTSGENPQDLLGYGTWSAMAAGRVLVGVDTANANFDSAMKTGGFKTHALSIDQLPSHVHPQQGFENKAGNSNPRTESRSRQCYSTDDTEIGNDVAVGGSQPHNNLSPYVTVFMFRRTA